MKIRNINIELKNFFQLKVEITANGDNLSYAYYLYKNKDVIDKSTYSSNTTKQYNLTEPGNYWIRVYVKDKQGVPIIENSDKVSFKGFQDYAMLKKKKPIIIYGVSKLSAALNLILQEKYKVDFFMSDDLSKQGQDFFGIPIINIETINEVPNYKVLVVNGLDEITKAKFDVLELDYDIFTNSSYPNNIVFEVMYNLSTIRLYQISRQCYLNGLLEGANFIKDFIRFKFNSIIPYTAEIDEGTRLGYGGIGVVIHTKAKIGKNCVISQNVTIGSRGINPIIGDNVFIGPGSKCIGGRIGSNVVIGANSVVTKEIPNNCVAAGVPAKVISTDIEKYFSYIN